MENVYIVYHKIDFDGICSASIIYNYFKTHTNLRRYLIPMDYNDEFNLWDKVGIEDTVYMVDFSLPFDDMVLLNQITTLVWIDHHESAIKEYDDSNIFFGGIQRSGIGACALVWDYFHSKEMPKYVEYIAKYDVWDHSNPDVVIFQYGLLTNYSSENPKSYVWKTLDNVGFFQTIIDDGEVAYRYHTSLCEKYCKKYAFEGVFDDSDVFYRVICVNAGNGAFNSQLFDSVWGVDYDFMVLFSMLDDKTYHISIYGIHDGINMGEIAKKFGGGGHAKAAGFECDELPFWKVENEC